MTAQCLCEAKCAAFLDNNTCIFFPSQVEGDGNEQVLSCVGGRSFRSVRERWWYIALSKCGVSTDL